MGGVVRSIRDAIYKPLPIFVLDPLEYTALGLSILSSMNGERRWQQCQDARWAHPDPQKVACVHAGAIIYTALFPERTHKEHRPPEAWMREAGITPHALSEARKQLELQDPLWQEKRAARQLINEHMDGATLDDKA